MPDWFYRTAARPALFALPSPTARALALGLIGGLGRTRSGRAVIEFLGHMAPDPRLTTKIADLRLPSPIGLGWRVDPEQRATLGLSHFGVGCMELLDAPPRCVRRDEDETLVDAASPRGGVYSQSKHADVPVPLLRRRIKPDGRESLEFRPGFSLAVLPWDTPVRPQECDAGLVLQVGLRLPEGGWRVPASPPATLANRVREWRKHLTADAPLVVAGGVAGPEDAVALVKAGANLVLVDAGLVFRGPGLVKRCNEALLAGLPPLGGAPSAEPNRLRRAWPWAAGLGVGLFVGGLATAWLAFGRVLLPYDEHYLGLSADALRLGLPRLFAFMAHDRGTLAGTMLGLGGLYAVLGWYGLRRGIHGAKTAVVASALTGFASFFSFFGFGYFDTLHAFVALLLFQLTTQIMTGSEAGPANDSATIDREDAAWRLAQWAQLLWLVHAAGLLLAGVVILSIGMGSVFVSEDLAFLCLTPEQAAELGPRLRGVVAHDRATLGGMLLASGVAMLLAVLWCFRRAASWLWHGVLVLGAPAYAAAIGVHLWVGYLDLRHLLPAFAGLALWALGLALGRGHLVPRRETA